MPDTDDYEPRRDAAAESERVEAFVEDQLNALGRVGAENMTAGETDVAFLDVERAHGYWRAGEGVNATVGLETPIRDIASIGISTGETGTSIGVKLDIPDRRSAAESLDGPSESGSPVSVSINRKAFAGLEPMGDNKWRSGIEFSAEATLDTEIRGKSVNGSVEVFVNQATDGSVVMGTSGEIVPTLLRGKVPLTVGGEYTREMIDTDAVVDRNIGIFEDMIEAAGPGGEEWARDVMYGVLEDSGGGGEIPTSKMVMAAAIGEHELTGKSAFAVDGSEARSQGYAYHQFKLDSIPENDGFYRVSGKVFEEQLPGQNAGSKMQEYDVIIDSAGNAVDGYITERQTGTVSAQREAFGAEEFSHERLGNVMDERSDYAFGRQGQSYALEQREAFIDEQETQLDELAASDLSAIHPDTHEHIWERGDVGYVSLDRLDANMDAKIEAAQDAISERAAEGSLGYLDMATGKALAHVGGAQAMVEDLRGAGVEDVDIRTHDVSDPVETMRETIMGLEEARREAGLEPPSVNYDAAHDHTNTSWPDYVRSNAAGTMEFADRIVGRGLQRGMSSDAEMAPPAPEVEHLPEMMHTPYVEEDYGRDIIE